jgi:sn-glycerol 3-phosphate transport system ATP-binding protein/multiple sugar transport system ATP-binding protein
MASVVVRDLHKKFGETHILKGVSIEVHRGKFAVLVGPSGCGKSTLLRLLAGLEEATSGTIQFDDRDVTALPPRDRDIAMVFQSYALYPHLSVRENMAFGLKLRKTPPAEIEKRVKQASAMLGLDNLLDRLPKQLSGGQRQRVAMGRAIVRRPSLFLFDEPLSNLDAALRAQVRVEIRKVHDDLEATSVYVTHDQVEAMTLADVIFILNKGVVEQAGHPLEVYARPATRFVASFLGSPSMNFVDVEIARDGGGWVATGKDELRIPFDAAGFEKSLAPGKKVTLGVRPHEVELFLRSDARGSGSPSASAAQNPKSATSRTAGEKGAPLTASIVEALGTESFAHGKLGGAPFVARLDAGAQIKKGETIELAFKAVHLFDRESGQSLRDAE